MDRILSRVVPIESDSEWYKTVIKVSDEDALEIRKERAIGDRSFMFENMGEKQEELFQQEYDLQREREESSLSETMLAGATQWHMNTMAGALLEKWGVGSDLLETINSGDYEQMQGYKNTQEFVSQKKLELGLNNTEEDALFSAKNPQHTDDLLRSFKTKRNAEEFINKTLTTTQQKVAMLTSMVDLDLALPLGLASAGGRGFLKVGKAGQWGTGVVSGTVGASKPYLVEETFKHGATDEQLLIEASLAGFVETLAGRFLTPEIRRASADEMSTKIANKIIAENSGAIKETGDKAEDFIATPKGSEETLDIVMRAVDEELRATTASELNRLGFKAEVAGYSHASKDINTMFKNISDFILENRTTAEAKVLIKNLRKEFDDIIEVVSKLDGVDAKTLSRIKARTAKSLDNFEEGTIGKLEKDNFKKINEMLSKVRKNPRLLIKEGLYEPIKKATAKVRGLETEVKLLRKQLKELGKEHKKFKEASNELAKKQKQLDRAKNSLDKTTDTQINKLSDKKIKELEQDGMVLKFNKKTGRYTWKGKVLPAALVIGIFGGTDAFASDGELNGSVLLSTWQGFIIGSAIALMGYSGVKNMMHSRAVQARLNAQIKANGGIVEEAKSMEKAKNALHGNYESVRNAFNETFAPLLKYAKQTANPELKAFIEKVLVDPMNGKSLVAEEVKINHLRSFMSQYVSVESKLFKQWFKMQGVGIKEIIAEPFTGRYLEKFREYVASMKDGAIPVPDKGSEFIKEMADTSSKLVDQMGLGFAKEIGLEGADEIVKLQDYLKRAYNSEAITLMRRMSETTDGKAQLHNAFKKMYIAATTGAAGSVRGFMGTSYKKLIESKSKKEFMDIFESQKNNLSSLAKDDTFIDEMLKKIDVETDISILRGDAEKLLKYASEMDTDKIASSKIAKYLANITSDQRGGGIAEVAGSFKHRVSLKMNAFEDFSVTIDGDVVDVSLKAIFDRNDYSLSMGYMRQILGRAGLKVVGYSIEDAKNIIGRIGDEDVKAMAERTLDAIVGNPLFDMPKYEQVVLQGISNIALAGSLPLVGLSFLQEMGYFVTRMIGSPRELSLVTRNIVDILRGYGDDSAMVTMLQKNIGLGTNRMNGSIGSRFDPDMRAAGINYVETNPTLNFTKMVRDLTFKASGMLALSDILELMNGIANMQRLHDIAHGLRKLNPAKAKAYGLTDEDLATARKYLKTNSRGHVIEPDWSKMTTKEQLRIQGVISSMGQKGAQRSTIGGTPDWSRKDQLGTALSKLVMYPTNAYANMGLHQIRSLSHGDVENSMQIFGGYVGSMIGLQLRDGVLGKEREDEEYHLYSTLNLAQLGLIGTARAVFQDPAITFGGETAQRMISNSYSALAE